MNSECSHQGSRLLRDPPLELDVACDVCLAWAGWVQQPYLHAAQWQLRCALASRARKIRREKLARVSLELCKAFTDSLAPAGLQGFCLGLLNASKGLWERREAVELHRRDAWHRIFQSVIQARLPAMAALRQLRGQEMLTLCLPRKSPTKPATILIPAKWKPLFG